MNNMEIYFTYAVMESMKRAVVSYRMYSQPILILNTI